MRVHGTMFILLLFFYIILYKTKKQMNFIKNRVKTCNYILLYRIAKKYFKDVIKIFFFNYMIV